MRILVTGAAGFIGSHLCERLLAEGHDVLGADCFIDYYPRSLKEKNLSLARESSRFEFREVSLARGDLSGLLEVDVVFHQAAQAGVRASWGEDFSIYVENNILATQRLLEASKRVHLSKFVYASSSSVYGDAETLPTSELARPQPISPYGVSKLAAEHLCYLYWKNFGIPTVSLRYFTVYGPRQRPDMAFNRFLRALIAGDPIRVFGNGEQSRDFTFISDAVDANLSAMVAPCAGEVFNIGGGDRATVNQVLRIMEDVSGKTANMRYQSVEKGDVKHTAADIAKAKDILSYSPKVSLKVGIREEFEWLASTL